MPTAEAYCCFCGKLARAHVLRWEYTDDLGRPIRLIWHESCALEDPLHDELATADATAERLHARGDESGALAWAEACGDIVGRIITRVETMEPIVAADVLMSIAKRKSEWSRALAGTVYRMARPKPTDEQREILRLLKRGAGR